jgi:hypothetical protein
MPGTSTLSPDLTDARRAIDDLLDAADRCAEVWNDPVAPGKWSPAQILEHVARSIEDSAKDMHGEPSRMMQVPAPLRFLPRIVFRRVLRTGSLFKAKTNAGMNPEAGPASPAEGRERMESAWKELVKGRQSLQGPARSRIFGTVPGDQYVRFQALHARHHIPQFPTSS